MKSVISFINNKFPSHKIHFSFNQISTRIKSFSSSSDTIYALSSGNMIKSGVAVIRISGPSSMWCLDKLLDNPKNKNLKSPDIKPRYAYLKKIYCPESNEILDQALVISFPGPKSFTGEDVVELQLHGSRAVLKGLFDAFRYLDKQLYKTNYSVLRPAEPGEFTRRAFDNGKIDLTEVEGLSDLLSADTRSQRKLALKQMEGSMSKQFESWRNVLIKCLAHSEAVIDFGDDDRENDITDTAMLSLYPRIESLRGEISTKLKDGRRGELIRDGVRISISGPPNAGKSSLINSLSKRPAAIVSPIAGTTRDIVEVRLDLDGISCILSDTAGLREFTTDPIEEEGMIRAKQAFLESQIKLFVCDASSDLSLKESLNLLQQLLSSNYPHGSDESNPTANANEMSKTKLILVLNKSDISGITENSHKLLEEIEVLIKKHTSLNIENSYDTNLETSISISCLTGSGINELENLITNNIKSIFETSSETLASDNDDNILITRDRHRRHLEETVQHLDMFLKQDLPMDLAAEELRLAMMEIGKITGRVDVDEILDIIFKDFCIGK